MEKPCLLRGANYSLRLRQPDTTVLNAKEKPRREKGTGGAFTLGEGSRNDALILLATVTMEQVHRVDGNTVSANAVYRIIHFCFLSGATNNPPVYTEGTRLFFIGVFGYSAEVVSDFVTPKATSFGFK